MAISETSNACSRTIGLKPLVVGEWSAKSKVTKSDLIDPFFNAAVPGWSPSEVRSRIVISIRLRIVNIDEARLRKRFAHPVHVEPEHAGSELLAFALLVRLAFFAFGGDLGSLLPGDHHDPVVIGDHGIARMNIDARAGHPHVDGAQRRFHRAFGPDLLRPHRKSPIPHR